MALEPLSSLDQGIDPDADFYSKTVEEYDSYQLREYDHNYDSRKQYWDSHFDEMRGASSFFLGNVQKARTPIRHCYGNYRARSQACFTKVMTDVSFKRISHI